jgi:hypothetical protein
MDDAVSEPQSRSGGHTEHDLRQRLRSCEARRTQLERVVDEARRYTQGAREKGDLQRLKAALAAAGHLPPK